MNLINYKNLHDASVYYENCGFRRIETPWWVTEEINDVTKPADATSYKIDINDKVLVASGEQSFLYMINKGQLPPGKYQTITPCFRNEHFDTYHSKYFMKLELIWILNNENKDIRDYLLSQVISDAKVLFLKQIEVEVVKTEQSLYDKTIISDSYDIVTKDGLELGSYGIRQCDFATWIYGTGIAEPRFSKAVTKHLRSIEL